MHDMAIGGFGHIGFFHRSCTHSSVASKSSAIKSAVHGLMPTKITSPACAEYVA
jgi:hypothetical protein